MINRSLIRIKTIQILYQYLLTRSDFTTGTPPTADSTADQRIAYSVYLDLLLLILKLSSQSFGVSSGVELHPDPVMSRNCVGKSLRDSHQLMAQIRHRRERFTIFDSKLDELSNAIVQSGLYNEYRHKRKHSVEEDVTFWKTILTTLIRKNKAVEHVLRANGDFSHAGFDMGVEMLLKTLDSFDDSRTSLIVARKTLENSLTLSYSLYHALLMLPSLITSAYELRIERARSKYRPTPEDLNPNFRLVDNLYVRNLAGNEAMHAYIADHPEADPANWRDSDILAQELLEAVLASDLYKVYSETVAGDYATDASFWREALRTIVFPSDALSDSLETQNVYWNDDLPIMGTFALKTIRRSYAANDGEEEVDAQTDKGKIVLLPKFMNSADESFGPELFDHVVENRELYREYIDRFINSEQWDSERLAFMDIVLMLTALAEIIYYPSIPVPVSFNEYIEIANDYSTPRSGSFINGLLSNIVKMLNSEGIISKKL